MSRDAEADRTQPVPAYPATPSTTAAASEDPTEPVPSQAGAEATQHIPAYADSERTQPTTPRQPTAEQAADNEATMVIPQADVEKFRR